MSDHADTILCPDHLYETISAWTGIPTQRLRASSQRVVEFEELKAKLEERVLGQRNAIQAVVSGLARRYKLPERTGVHRPIWNALFVGPSGVGKTELARQLALHFFGKESALIKVDCSELDHSHHLARLVGAPPGFVGHGEEGQLIRELNRCSHGVLLLDEVEKAHPKILSAVVLPIIGEGQISDMSTGRSMDASNLAVLLTCNLALNHDAEPPNGLESADEDPTRMQKRSVQSFLDATFPREILGRLDDVVVFDPLSVKTLRLLWMREISSAERRFATRGSPVQIRMEAEAVETILQSILPEVQREGARALVRAFDRVVTDRCLQLLEEHCSDPVAILISSTAAGGLRLRVEAYPAT
jgi:ATP-dependent Clp protease ATP-binding subunit ClpA